MIEVLVVVVAVVVMLAVATEIYELVEDNLETDQFQF